MRSHLPSPALQLLRTPLAEPGGDGLARELVELCRYEPDLHISSLHIAASILRACEGRVVAARWWVRSSSILVAQDGLKSGP